ncbi:hypothetical protein BGX28_003825 [Mortierella sp. GBA30]|nr:hypothetical protein BGX28_003825 [Mortierella sp. GBA30]
MESTPSPKIVTLTLSRGLYGSSYTEFLAQNTNHLEQFLAFCKTTEGSEMLTTIFLLLVMIQYLPKGKFFQKGSWSRLTLWSLPVLVVMVKLGVGLERAPNTGRWRFMFVNKEYPDLSEEQKTAIQQELLSSDVIEDPMDERVLLVKHVTENLLKAIQKDGSTLRPFLCDFTNEGRTMKVNEVSYPAEDRSTEQDTSERDANDRRVLKTYISEDDEINAYALLSRVILVSSGLLRFIDNDEDMVAAVIAHELAHVIQKHNHEDYGQQTIRDMITYGIAWSLWRISVYLGPFFSSAPFAVVVTKLKPMIEGPMAQALEYEADMLSMEIMARAGYDPIHAARFYDNLAKWEEYQLLSITEPKAPVVAGGSDTIDCSDASREKVKEPMEEENQRLKEHSHQRWYHSTHPSSRCRQQYLTDAMYEVREKYRMSEKLRKNPVKRFQTQQRLEEIKKKRKPKMTPMEIVVLKSVRTIAREIAQALSSK